MTSWPKLWCQHNQSIGACPSQTHYRNHIVEHVCVSPAPDRAVNLGALRSLASKGFYTDKTDTGIRGL